MSDLTALLSGEVTAATPEASSGGGCVPRWEEVLCEVVLTEVEAYGGPDDSASHGFKGPTARNASMFGVAGTLYVYRSYGVHWCMNVVTGPPGRAEAVLLRGGVPTLGEEAMRRRRRREDHLTDGPGKLAQALGVSGECDGTSVLTGPVRLLEEGGMEGRVLETRRVGITRSADRLWRFLLVTPRRSTARVRPAG